MPGWKKWVFLLLVDIFWKDVGGFEDKPLGDYGVLEPAEEKRKWIVHWGTPYIPHKVLYLCFCKTLSCGSDHGLCAKAGKSPSAKGSQHAQLRTSLMLFALLLHSFFSRWTVRSLWEDLRTFMCQDAGQLWKWLHRKELNIVDRWLQIPEGERFRFCQHLISVSVLHCKNPLYSDFRHFDVYVVLSLRYDSLITEFAKEKSNTKKVIKVF